MYRRRYLSKTKTLLLKNKVKNWEAAKKKKKNNGPTPKWATIRKSFGNGIYQTYIDTKVSWATKPKGGGYISSYGYPQKKRCYRY